MAFTVLSGLLVSILTGCPFEVPEFDNPIDPLNKSLEGEYLGSSFVMPAGVIAGWSLATATEAEVWYNEPSGGMLQLMDTVEIATDGFFPGLAVGLPPGALLVGVGDSLRIVWDFVNVDDEAAQGLTLAEIITDDGIKMWKVLIGPAAHTTVQWWYVDRDVHVTGFQDLGGWIDDFDLPLRTGWNRVLWTEDLDAQRLEMRLGPEPAEAAWQDAY